jgi:hypothetical protein
MIRRTKKVLMAGPVPLTEGEAKELLVGIAGEPWTVEDVLLGEIKPEGVFCVCSELPNLFVSQSGVRDFNGGDVDRAHVVSILVNALIRAGNSLPWEREIAALGAEVLSLSDTVEVVWYCGEPISAPKWQGTDAYECDECETSWSSLEKESDWEEGSIYSECPSCGKVHDKVSGQAELVVELINSYEGDVK